MKPISHERKVWVEDRIKVLDATITDLTARSAWYANKVSSVSESLDDVRNAVVQLRAERVALFAEYQVLSRMGVAE